MRQRRLRQAAKAEPTIAGLAIMTLFHTNFISIYGRLAGGQNTKKKKTSSKNKASKPKPEADGNILEADLNGMTAPDASGELADCAMAEAAAEQANSSLLAGPDEPTGDLGSCQNAPEVAAVDGIANADAVKTGRLFSIPSTYIVN